MVKVCDAIMGSGKTSATINYINDHPEKRFLYLSPYTNEATRINLACPEAKFVEPSDELPEFQNSKSTHSMHLIQEGRNIASTHQALQFYKPETFDLLRKKGYTVIIDEAPAILAQEKDIHYSDVAVLVQSGHVYECAPKEFALTGKEYDGTRMRDIYRTMQSRNLVYTRGKGKIAKKASPWYWLFSTMLFQKVDNVIILTYLFDRQEICSFMKMNEIKYQKIGIKYDGQRYEFSDTEFYVPDYVRRLGNMIHIEQGAKINEIGDSRTAMSMTWYENGKNDYEQVQKNLINYFNQKTPGKKDARMVGFLKDGWGKIRGSGYWYSRVNFNERATNEYRDRYVLAYPVNVFANRDVVTFYKNHGQKFDDDGYALTTMIQWIWRSAIRDGHEIWIYVPSKRMRTLLQDWIREVGGT